MQCRIFAVVTNYNNASETPHSSPNEPRNENFPENAASRGGGRDFSLSSTRLLGLFAEPLAVGQEPLHPSGGLRCPARLGRRFRQGWRNVRLAGSPTGQARQESVIVAAPQSNKNKTDCSSKLQTIKPLRYEIKLKKSCKPNN